MNKSTNVYLLGKMPTSSLTKMCCESLVNKIGEMPDHLQILVGEAAFKKLQRQERKRAKKEMLELCTKELSIILPDIIREEMQRQSMPILHCSQWMNVDPSILNCARQISQHLLRSAPDNLFFLHQ